ncbi:MAG TPA: tRNA (N6-threonylcarbamoyladenosine(37)-N6)-methyltransferase TrmO [Bacteroidales bacterium]|nr:tRNA (N6-threonylcarbamoyladenosine(37)-N6)-methyltransferase TrmO [Bacteroidales bacterium]
MPITFNAIGHIRTPYKEQAPFRPDLKANGRFMIEILPEYSEALLDLEKFSHIIVLFHFDRAIKTNLRVHPPSLEGRETGLFASRSPNRINKIGMDIVQLIKVEGNLIYTSPMDILDNTPLLDIKPYLPDIDCHPKANSGQLG